MRAENLLIGLLRAGTRPLHVLKDSGRMEVERFHAELADRLAPANELADLSELPMHADSQAVIEAAIATAAARRQGETNELYLLHALTGRDEDPVAQLLARYGVSAAKLHAGKTVSEVAREILRSVLEERALEERTSHLKGRLRLEKSHTEAWHRSLRQRNWRD